MKTCPACVEEIHTDAKKCKHCGERFDGAATRSPAQNAAIGVLGLFFLGGGWSTVANLAEFSTATASHEKPAMTNALLSIILMAMSVGFAGVLAAPRQR